MTAARLPRSIAVLGLSWFGCAAGATEGHFHDMLVAAIRAEMAGRCPATLLAEDIIAACQQDQRSELPSLAARLGAFRTATFEGVRPVRGGHAEFYRVIFERGEMTWFIRVAGEGKITFLWGTEPRALQGDDADAKS